MQVTDKDPLKPKKVIGLNVEVIGVDSTRNNKRLSANTLISLADGETFTPFEELTEEQVTNWFVSRKEIEDLKAGLEQQMAVENILPLMQDMILPPPWQDMNNVLVPQMNAISTASGVVNNLEEARILALIQRELDSRMNNNL